METGQDIETSIRSVMSGRWYVETHSENPARQLLVMRYPLLHELQRCHFLKQKFTTDHAEDLMGYDEAKSHAYIQGVWSDQYDNQLEVIAERIDTLQEQVEEHRELSKKIVAHRNRVRIIEKEIDRLNFRYKQLLERKQAVFGNTLEYMAEKQRLFYLVGCITEYPDGSPVWEHGNIKNEDDESLLMELSASLMDNAVIDTKMIRAIARSNLWRYRWLNGKSNVKTLFGRDIFDLSLAQSELLFWSQIYDAAMEAYEPPPSFVIDDDDRFDEWLADQAEKREGDKVGKYYKFDNFRGNENFVMVNGEYGKDGYWREYTQDEKDEIAKRVYGQNSPIIRKMQKEAKARIDQHGGAPVSECHLRRGYFNVLGWDRIKGQGNE